MMQWVGGWVVVLVLCTQAATIHWPFFTQQTSKGDRFVATIGQQRLYMVFDTPTAYAYGDMVDVAIRIKPCSPPTNPGQFNACRWMFKEGIDAMALVRSHRLILPSTKSSALIWAAGIPKRLLARCQQLFPRHAGVIYTMIFGGRQRFISPAVNESFHSVGLIHLLVVSGAQISALTGVMLGLLRVARCPFVVIFPMLLTAQGLYCGIAGFDASIIRSIVMTDALIWNHFHALRRYPMGWYIGLAVAVVVIINPKSALGAGFWYSFCLTFALMALVQPIMARIKGPRWFVGYSVASMVAVVVAIPIQLIQSSVVAPMAIVANLWVAWMSAVVLLGGLLCVCMSPPMLVLAQQLGIIIDTVADIMIQSSQTLRQLMGVWALDRVTIITAIGVLALFGIAIGGLRWHSRRNRHDHAQIQGRIKTCVMIMVCGSLGAFAWVSVTLSQRQFVMAIDVGQGDATLVVNGFNAILVDTGGKMGDDSAAKKIIAPVLHYYGINTLDALIITHQDMDHSFGVSDIVAHGTSVIYTNEALAINHHLVANPVDIHMRNGRIRLIPPSMLFPNETSNNRSLLVYITLSGVSFLISGDMDEWMELQMLRHNLVPSVDVLKLGHHGSKTSTSSEWLDSIRPTFVWNSAGKRNRYGHPHPSVIDRVSERRIPWLGTHHNGAIQMRVDADHLSIITHHLKKTYFLPIGDE